MFRLITPHCSHFCRVSFGLVWSGLVWKLATIVWEAVCLSLIVSDLKPRDERSKWYRDATVFRSRQTITSTIHLNQINQVVLDISLLSSTFILSCHHKHPITDSIFHTPYFDSLCKVIASRGPLQLNNSSLACIPYKPYKTSQHKPCKYNPPT